jgi:hypothetical protein
VVQEQFNQCMLQIKKLFHVSNIEQGNYVLQLPWNRPSGVFQFRINCDSMNLHFGYLVRFLGRGSALPKAATANSVGHWLWP